MSEFKRGGYCKSKKSTKGTIYRIVHVDLSRLELTVRSLTSGHEYTESFKKFISTNRDGFRISGDNKMECNAQTIKQVKSNLKNTKEILKEQQEKLNELEPKELITKGLNANLKIKLDNRQEYVKFNTAIIHVKHLEAIICRLKEMKAYIGDL